MSKPEGTVPMFFQYTSFQLHYRQEHIVKGVSNKMSFLALLSKCSMSTGIEVVGEECKDYDHEEAVVTVVSCALEHLHDPHCSVVYLPAEDTDVFLLLNIFH